MSTKLDLASTRRDTVLVVRQTARGLVVSIAAEAIEIAPRGPLACGELRVLAERDATVTIGGDLREHTGSAVREAALGATIEARAVAIEATGGDAVITANDDIDVKGDRIEMNPPIERS